MRAFTVPIGSPSSTEESLNSFLRSHRVVNVIKEFVSNGENSLWAILVEYLVDNDAAAKGRGKVDYRRVLSEEDFALFSRLRELRKRISEEHGVPAYAVLTNEQLATVAVNRPASRQALELVPGIGKGKVEQYGQIFLEAVAAYANADDPGTTP